MWWIYALLSAGLSALFKTHGNVPCFLRDRNWPVMDLLFQGPPAWKSKVAPVDKLSVALAIILSVVFPSRVPRLADDARRRAYHCRDDHSDLIASMEKRRIQKNKKQRNEAFNDFILNHIKPQPEKYK